MTDQCFFFENLRRYFTPGQGGGVDVRLDDVGEWGEEEPGAFMAKNAIEPLLLRACTAGDVVLSWNSDKVELYTDSECQEPDKVVEDGASVGGSREATFYPDEVGRDIWGAEWRGTLLWAKASEASTVLRDVHLRLWPVSGDAPPDLVNVTVADVELKSISFVDGGEGCGGDNEHLIRENSTEHQGWGVGAEIADPVWIADGPDEGDDPDRNRPVCYTRSTDDVSSRLRINLVIRVSPPRLTFNLAGLYGETEHFRNNRETSTGADQTISMVCGVELPKTVDAIERTFSWRAEIAFGLTVAVGDSTHDIYVTYDTPLDDVTPLRLEIVCNHWAKGSPNMHEAADSIQFAIQGMPPYFDGGVPRRDDIWYMMENTPPPHWNAGDCLSLAMLIEEALQTIGIASETGVVRASTNDGNAWEDLEYHPAHLEGSPDPWPLYFTTGELNFFEGVAKLQEDGCWYYFAGAPHVDGDHATDAGASINLLRAYVEAFEDGKQEYYQRVLGEWVSTGIEEPVPPAP